MLENQTHAIIIDLKSYLMEKTNKTPHLENRCYGFKEFAVLYFPNIAPASASIRLKQWILTSAEVVADLEATGYQRTQRILTPRQRDIIVTAFGSPF